MTLLVGISSFIFSVLIAVCVVFITFKIFARFSGTDMLKELSSGNSAVGIILAGEMTAFGILMLRALYPVSAVLQDLFIGGALSAGQVFKTLGYICAYAVFAYMLSVFVVFISSRVFQFLTRSIDERALIRKGNIAVAIVLAGMVITVAVMVQSGLADVLNTLIPQMGSGVINVR